MGEVSSDTKVCPFCGETIKAVAIKCKHCGEFLDKRRPPAVAASAPVAQRTSTPFPWWIPVVAGVVAIIVGYVLGNMIAGAVFQSQVSSVLQGGSADAPSEGTIVGLSILVCVVVAEAVAITLARRRRARLSGAGK